MHTALRLRGVRLCAKPRVSSNPKNIMPARSITSAIRPAAAIALSSVSTVSKQQVLTSSLFSVSKKGLTINQQQRRFLSYEEGEQASKKMRNVAIIAHVDHGKTTLVDELLKQSGQSLDDERAMDSNDLEKERGITIMAKNTAMYYKDYKINLVDTPGHGDFGGEVERMMGLVDGVVLLVDAAEGVMTQTKFVLGKALKAGLKPIVVLNKMDRTERVRTAEVEEELFELFLSLGAEESQMDYPVLYASGRSGWAVNKPDDPRENLNPLFEAIVTHVPPMKLPEEKRFTMSVTLIDSDPYLGRIVTGRISSGMIKTGASIKCINLEGGLIETGKVTKLMMRRGMEKHIVEEGHIGDIVSIAGLASSNVTHTICEPSITTAVQSLKYLGQSIPLDPPVLSMGFSVNNSPLAGTEGTKQTTFANLKRRLQKEVETNVSISLKMGESEIVEVCGRGELQLGILIENLRREGMEFAVYPPQVMMKNHNGRQMEPMEEVIIDVEDEYSGFVIERMNQRKAEFVDQKQVGGKSRVIFKVISRALLGFRAELMQQTKGTAVFNHTFSEYVEYTGKLETTRKGALVSNALGTATGYALEALEARGVLFIKPGMKVYPGMIIGENSKSENLEVNPTKAKQLSNVRTTQKEDTTRLVPPKEIILEEAISTIRADESLEITPQTIRLRKSPGFKIRG
ncbi:hypothetical protein PROFUN_06392 [Planoprotostelium fungivorum]|uniref:Tr-type G domain-containing protein n=1 Tax=Planoprotostelium fungivorum TaxID=1890364 RepID=A0A2P6NNR8_9EUKA|nr:hypothetical protein PROFUN_06392 [Planoprotostelium fungivorum]